MQKLNDGIHQYQSESFLPLQKLFERLAEGQHPDKLFITCSNSRIDLPLLTNAQRGDLFLLRNPGNIVPPHGAGIGEKQRQLSLRQRPRRQGHYHLRSLSLRGNARFASP